MCNFLQKACKPTGETAGTLRVSSRDGALRSINSTVQKLHNIKQNNNNQKICVFNGTVQNLTELSRTQREVFVSKDLN